MKVTIKFFASIRDATGVEEMKHEFKGSNISDLIISLKKVLAPSAYSEITAKNVKIALNQELIEKTAVVTEDDEIAFLPPVTGG